MYSNVVVASHTAGLLNEVGTGSRITIHEEMANFEFLVVDSQLAYQLPYIIIAIKSSLGQEVHSPRLFPGRAKMDWKTVNWVAVVPQALLGLVFTTIIYRRLFSPIRNIPGPALASISRFWHIYHIIKGDQNLALIKQHEKHGKQKMTWHDGIRKEG